MISAMLDYRLSAQQLIDLRRAHRGTRDKRTADRIKVVVLLGGGWTAEQAAETLLIGPNSVRNHFRRYRVGVSRRWVRRATAAATACSMPSNAPISRCLCAPTSTPPPRPSLPGCRRALGCPYSPSGMTALLHRLGFVYKKPKLVPGKADPEAQRKFLADCEEFKENNQEAPIYFMDATYPQHNPHLGCGWIKRGADQSVPTNSGQRRLNINGAIELKRLEPLVRFDERIDADSTIALCQQIEQNHSFAAWIFVICYNALYYRSRAVASYLKGSRIKLLFLPPYAPNLNLIERLWKFFKKTALYNRYYESFFQLKEACSDFFKNSSKYQPQLRSLLTENFAIVGE
jgi:transposase